MSSDGTLDKEIVACISKASQSMGRLRSRVLKNRNIRLLTKIKVYKSVVLTSLLHGCETWTMHTLRIRQLERFHMRSLRNNMGLNWQDNVSNLSVLDS